MIERLKRTILQTAEENVRGYILVAGVFLAGVVLAFILNLSSGSEEEMKLYIGDFISNVKNYSTDSVKTFGIAVRGYTVFTVVLFVMSITVVGSLCTLGYVFVKGFSYGAVLLAVSNMLGGKSVLFFVCTILPHAIITVPCFASYSLFCIKNSYSISKGAKDLKKFVLMPFLYGILCMMFCGVAALLQAYIEPLLIRVVNF